MNTHITGTGLSVTDELRDYFEKSVHKIEKLIPDEDARLEVEFERLADHKTDDEFRAEIMLRAPGLELRAEERHAVLHSAIDGACDNLIAELRKVKGKKKRLFRLEGLKFKEFLRGWRK